MSCSDLPIVSFDDCAPEIKSSQLQKLYVALYTAPAFTNWKNGNQWAARISADSQDANAIRELTIIGDVPAPSASEKDVSGGRKIAVNTEYTVNFDIDDTRPLNYEFVRASQCGIGLKVRAWYYTGGGMLFGGNSGIRATMRINPVYGRGDEIEKYTGTLKWYENESPERTENPVGFPFSGIFTSQFTQQFQ